ncbi:hypothetical protein AB0G67_38980 [Streptomyces sp. NPDC021056]|uniref:ankyrin repeat domain-containing protein n=1 Tax=Streptomyces sp. NPDC021056 TaxID=3155012 RepID=UPI0033EB8CB4
MSDTVRATTGTDDDLFHAVSPAHGARPPEQVARIRALLAEGAEVSAPDEQGATPLHRAVQAPYQDRDPLPSLEVVRALLESGADVHARDRIGVTPAARAVLLNDTSTQAAVDRSVAVLELLVEHGARLDGPCGDVMVGSFAHHSTTATPVYAFLLDHGAPTTAPLGVALRLDQYKDHQRRARSQIVPMLEAVGAPAHVRYTTTPWRHAPSGDAWSSRTTMMYRPTWKRSIAEPGRTLLPPVGRKTRLPYL